MVGIEQTAADAVATLVKILELKTHIEQNLQPQFGRRSVNAHRLLQHLFQHPVISVEQAAAVCGTHYGPANELVAQMRRYGILKEMTGQSRNRLFLFEPYLRVFDDAV